MSRFTSPRTARKVPPYRPPAMLWRDRAAPAVQPQAPPPPPAGRRDPSKPAVAIAGEAFELTIVDEDNGNPYTGPKRIFDFRRPGGRPDEVIARVTDYRDAGPQCWCRGLPHAQCPHIAALVDEGYILSADDLDVRWGIGPGEGGEP